MSGPKPRASDRAFALVQERILDLRLPPGTLIKEQALAEELELGRMPVREALARLASANFVTILPRRGSVVSVLSLDDIVSMFEAREAIECGVAFIVAQRATAADLAALRALVETANRAREAADHEGYLRDDYAIHAFLIKMVRNSWLQAAAENLLLHNLRFWRTYWASRPAQQTTMIPHGDLLEALEAHNPQAAEIAMRRHLDVSRHLLQASF